MRWSPHGPVGGVVGGAAETTREIETMAQPKRIQRKRTKGWRMPPGAVYVGRPTKWGNPWRPVTIAGGRILRRRPGLDERRRLVRAYRMGVRGRWARLQKLMKESAVGMLSVIVYFQTIRRSIKALRGKNLCC